MSSRHSEDKEALSGLSSGVNSEALPRDSHCFRQTTGKARPLDLKDEVQVRRALLSDYESVINLADIDGGQDYLYALFKQFVTDEDTYALVATMDDMVVRL